ncbi:MAG: hypothetical protein WCE90_09065 [Candidatus Zixiibacteriota bacterium]
MKRTRFESPGLDYRISTRDYYQIFTSALFLLIGVVILVRSLCGGVFIMALLVAGGFLTLGGYRLRFVLRYFRERRKCSHT